ncbi:fungal-specific transcription factor domain-containing protein [Mariannaea sp. PMI_226]|nr:fungal-specific transcription factor domain-containing protein [Mariannaea sp. PMI_226]
MASTSSDGEGIESVADQTGLPSLTSTTRPRARQVRRYGFACTGCKARKVKCSGEQPICQNCRRSGDDCTWPSQTSTESRLRSANARIRNLEASIRQSTQKSSEFPRTEAVSTQQVSEISPAITNDETSPATSHALSSSATSLWFQVGIGEDGSITYNGPTSRFHAGSLKEVSGSDGSDSNSSQLDALRSQYVLMDSIWMPLINAQPFMRGTGVATETGLALLDIYWTWLHPLHNCVYKPAMLMDLALGGPYCSDFLLMCIFGLVARHLPEHTPNFHGVGKGDEFISRAKILLLEEMSAARPSIPTIQGLLILGGRQGAMGNSSEGWLYTGMAFRLMTDIGLHLDMSRLSKLERWTPAETETRKRLYNSAYIWDKTLSLALGRPPSLTKRPYPSHEILDKFDDERPWRPIHALEVLESFSTSPALNSSTFCAFCSIHEITTDMMLLFSNIPDNENFATQVGDLDTRFKCWYDDLQGALKISQPSSMVQSPPPHIVSLNLLYHTLRILLRRPYLMSPEPRQRDHHMSHCLVHLQQIYAIHRLYTRTFPHHLMTYQVSYCIFIAASTEVQELRTASSQSRRDEAATRLAAAVKVLKDEASQTPGIGRTLDTIRSLLSTGQHRTETIAETSSGNNARRVAREEELTATQADRDQVQSSRQGIPGSILPVTPQFSHINGVPGMDDYSPLLFPGNGFGVVDELGPSWTNTGAGFHPEAMPWAALQHWQLPP